MRGGFLQRVGQVLTCELALELLKPLSLIICGYIEELRDSIRLEE